MQPKPDIAPATGAHYEGSVLVGGDQSAKAPAASPSARINPGPTSLVVHEVKSTSPSDDTLALVLASSALGLALCGSGYAVIRVTRIQRGALSSN
jgi:hypothetical protein